MDGVKAFVLDQRKAVGYRKAGGRRLEAAILEGDESFFLKSCQYLLFLTQEITVILVHKVLEGNPFLRPEPEVKSLQSKLFNRQGLILFNRKISRADRSEVSIEGAMIPPALIAQERVGRRAKAEKGGVVPVFLIVP